MSLESTEPDINGRSQRKTATLHRKSDTLYQSICIFSIHKRLAPVCPLFCGFPTLQVKAFFNQNKGHQRVSSMYGHEVTFRVPCKFEWPSCLFEKTRVILKKHEEMLRNHQGYPRIQFKTNDLSRFLLGPTICIYQQVEILHIWKIQV